MYTPVQNGYVSKRTGLFGCRRRGRSTGPDDPRCGPGERWHAGMDVGRPEGSPVYAVGEGVIVFASDVNGNRYWGRFGRLVLLKTGRFYVLYAHLARVVVHTGEHVQAGQVIATVGVSEGSAVQNDAGEWVPNNLVFPRRRGPHVHFEVSDEPRARWREMRYMHGNLDPLQWLAVEGVRIHESARSFQLYHGAELPEEVSEPMAEVDETVIDSVHHFTQSLRDAVASTTSAILETIQNIANVAEREAWGAMLVRVHNLSYVNRVLLDATISAYRAGGVSDETMLRMANIYGRGAQHAQDFWASVGRGDLSEAKEHLIAYIKLGGEMWTTANEANREVVSAATRTAAREAGEIATNIINDLVGGALGQMGAGWGVALALLGVGTGVFLLSRV